MEPSLSRSPPGTHVPHSAPPAPRGGALDRRWIRGRGACNPRGNREHGAWEARAFRVETALDREESLLDLRHGNVRPARYTERAGPRNCISSRMNSHRRRANVLSALSGRRASLLIRASLAAPFARRVHRDSARNTFVRKARAAPRQNGAHAYRKDSCEESVTESPESPLPPRDSHMRWSPASGTPSCGPTANASTSRRSTNARPSWTSQKRSAANTRNYRYRRSEAGGMPSSCR